MPALLHQLSRTGSPIHTEDFRSSAAPPTVKDRISNSHRRLSFQRCSTNCQGQVLQFTPKTFAPALLHQLSKTGSPIHTEDFRSSAAPPTVKDRFSIHTEDFAPALLHQLSRTVLQFTPKTFVPALLHQLSRTGSLIHTEDFVPALLHQLSRTGSPIHTEDFRSSAAPPIVKDRFFNSHQRLSFQRCSTNCQGQVLQFTPKTFAPALLHQLSRTCSPIHTEDFRSSAAPPTVKDRFSNLHRRLSLQRCSTNCQGPVFQFTPKTFAPALLHHLSKTSSPTHTEVFRSSAAPPTVKDRFSNSHRRLSLQRCSTNCQGQVLQFTPKTFVPALLHQLSRTGSPIHTEDFRSNAAPPTVKDRFSNSHRRLSFQRCSTNCQGQGSPICTQKTFAPTLLHQLSRTGSPIHTEDFRSSAAPPTVKDRFSNSHRRLSFQRCSTNCQGQVLQFTPKTFVPALLHQLSRTGSPIHTEDFRSSAAPPTVKDSFSNSHRRLSFQRCSTNCQGQVLQFTPKTFVPALLHQLSRTGSPIHTEDFRSSAAPPTVKDRFSNSHRRLSIQRCSTNCQGQVLQFTPKTFVPALLHQLSRTGSSNSHRRLSFQRCSTNCQGQFLQFTPKTFAPALLHQLSRTGFQFTPKTFVPALLHQLSRTGFPIHTEDFRSSAAPPTVKDRFSNSHRRLSFQRCSTNCQGQVLQFTPKTFAPALLHQLSRTGSPIHTEHFRSSAAPPTVEDRFSNSHRALSLQRCSTNCRGQVLQFKPKTFVSALLHQLSRTGSPIYTEDFRSSAAPPTVKDRFSNSHRRLSFQRCSTNCQGQVFQFTPKTLAPALLHQLSRTVSLAPRIVKDKFSNSHRRLSLQRCSTNCQGQVLQFTPKTFDPALLHQLSRTGSPIHTEDFRSSAAPPTVKDRFSNSHRRLSFQRCSTNCQGQDLQFAPKTFVPALLHQLSRTVLQFTPKTFVPALLHQLSRTRNSPIHTEDFRSSAAPPTVKDRFSNSHRRLSFQRCSTNCQGQVLQFTEDFRALLHQQGQVLQFTPKTFVPTLLHQLSRTGSPIHTENFRSNAAPPTVKDRFSNSHRRLSLQRCSTNCQGQVLQFTPKTFVPALLHQLSRTSSPIHTEDFRSNAAPPTVKDKFSNSHRRLSFQRCSTNCQGQVPIHTEDFRSSAAPPTFKDSSSAAPPTVKDKFSNSHRRLSFQRCSTNCQGQVLQFTPKTFAPALLHQLSRTSSPIHTEDFRSSAAPPTVKDKFSNSHRRLSLQRCSTNCQGRDLQFTPKTFVPTLLHQLSRTVLQFTSPIHTEDFRSSAAPPTVKDRFSNSHRRLSFKRCSTNCQRQDLQFTPKTFVPALLHQLSRTGSPIHTEDFRSSAAPPTVKDKFSNSHRRLSLQRCSTNCQGQVFQFTPKTFVPALLHQLSRANSPIHTEDFRSSAAPPTVKDRISNSHRRLSFQRCSTNCQGRDLQFTPKTFAPALLHQLSKTGSPIHTEDFRSSAAPPTVKDGISNSHRRLSFQRCSTNCQGRDLQFTRKTFVPTLLHQLSRTGSPIHTEDLRSSAAPPTVKDRFSNSHRRLSFQRCSTNCQGQVLQFTPKTFVPTLLHQLSRTGFPIYTENFRSSAAPPTVKDSFSNSHRRLSFQRCSTNCQEQDLQFTPKTFVPALLHQL